MKSAWERFEPNGWREYSLIDSGNGRKLERWGEVVTIRPEITAIWSPGLSDKEWHQLANAEFVQDGSRSGKWTRFKKCPDHWQISYPSSKGKLTFNLRFTQFKHIGVFPEQAANWEFIIDQVQRFPNPRVLNLFAYTGGASLAARAAGAEVTHVDSIRAVIDWTRENMESSRLTDIRWVVEDALRFVQREAKRGNTYHGVIMDPPSWGISPGKGKKKWKLEDQLVELIESTAEIVEKEYFLILNTYSGLANSTLETLIKTSFPPSNTACGDLILHSGSMRKLATGSCLRSWK
ncbi:MAG: class I SAM-dependent methyltransferase [Flavobacteriales bacterium]|nr:class I SAM-dependent methyltransferase [Flavobacteriales bacterium]